MSFKLFSILAVLGSAQAAVHNVNVGNGNLVFSPNSITAAKGDKVNFHFYPSSHSVAESTFSAPCVPSGSDAIYSGFMIPTSGVDNMMFQITINSTDPIWLYCSQISHCQSGMAMVINAPSGESISDYQAAAAKTTSSKSPGGVSGGVIIANSNSGGSSGAAPSGSASSSPSASAASSSASAASSAASSTAPSGTTTMAAASPSASSKSGGSSGASSIDIFVPGMVVAVAGVALGVVL